MMELPARVTTPSIMIQEDVRVIELEGLLRRVSIFVYRAANPSKVPHEQNEIDAVLLLEEIRTVLGDR